MSVLVTGLEAPAGSPPSRRAKAKERSRCPENAQGTTPPWKHLPGTRPLRGLGGGQPGLGDRHHGASIPAMLCSMDISVIGTGFIGGVLGRALASAGHNVTFGSRHPDSDDVPSDTRARALSLSDALTASDVVILAIPGNAVGAFAAEHGPDLTNKLVIDATNKMGVPITNSRAALPQSVRYARAFNTLGGENMASPVFPGGVADMFFSAPESDRQTVEEVISGVGLRPVYVGTDEEALVDCLFRLWVNLAMNQGRGRRLAFRLLEDS